MVNKEHNFSMIEYFKRRVILELEEHMSVTALVYIPQAAKTKPAPAILCNHGHGQFGKDTIMGIRSSNEPQRNEELPASTVTTDCKWRRGVT